MFMPLKLCSLNVIIEIVLLKFGSIPSDDQVVPRTFLGGGDLLLKFESTMKRSTRYNPRLKQVKLLQTWFDRFVVWIAPLKFHQPIFSYTGLKVLKGLYVLLSTRYRTAKVMPIYLSRLHRAKTITSLGIPIQGLLGLKRHWRQVCCHMFRLEPGFFILLKGGATSRLDHPYVHSPHNHQHGHQQSDNFSFKNVFKKRSV
jgi:hypothetical protein